MPTRRSVIQAAACTALGLSPAGGGPAAGPPAPGQLDYGRSFVCNTSKANAVRMWVESRTILVDPQAGTRTEYYQCGSCKSENTFAERDLFMANNYDFLPIFGAGKVLIFRRFAAVSARYRQIRSYADSWGEPVLKLFSAAQARRLEDWASIRDATAEAMPLVAETELVDEASGLRAILEYPVKTMNIAAASGKYQVDTGPVALPDLSQRTDPQIECLRLAYVAFNAPQFADFVIEDETPIVIDGKPACRVHHYAKLQSLPAANRLWAQGP